MSFQRPAWYNKKVEITEIFSGTEEDIVPRCRKNSPLRKPSEEGGRLKEGRLD